MWEKFQIKLINIFCKGYLTNLQNEFNESIEKLNQKHENILNEKLKELKTQHKKALRNKESDFDDELYELKRKFKQKEDEFNKQLKECEDKARDEVEFFNTQIQVLQKACEASRSQTKLISSILNAELNNEYYNKFIKIFEKDFLEFAKNENSLDDEAGAILKLQNICEKLKKIAGNSDIYTNHIIAVGGGFSAGKSEFINSFFKNYNNLKLPTDNTVATAVPTYVINAKNESFFGYNNNGGGVDLSYKDLRIDHDFLKSLGFNISSIMPYMALSKEFMIDKNIAFLDTPGYNPGSSGTSKDDYDKAFKALNEYENLIWVIPVNNGEMRNSDLEFLQKTNKKNIYIVVNKADMVNIETLKQVINKIKLTCEEKIKIKGISGYSSLHVKEMHYEMMSLDEYLNSFCDKPQNEYEKIINELEEVEQMYENAISKDIENKKEMSNLLHKLPLDLLKAGIDLDMNSSSNFSKNLKPIYSIMGFDTIFNKESGDNETGVNYFYNTLNKLKAKVDYKKQEESLKKLKRVMKDLKIAVKDIFEQKLNNC